MHKGKIKKKGTIRCALHKRRADGTGGEWVTSRPPPPSTFCSCRKEKRNINQLLVCPSEFLALPPSLKSTMALSCHIVIRKLFSFTTKEEYVSSQSPFRMGRSQDVLVKKSDFLPQKICFCCNFSAVEWLQINSKEKIRNFNFWKLQGQLEKKPLR